MRFCECGCGNIVKDKLPHNNRPQRFLKGHNQRGKSYWKGKKFSELHKKKISEGDKKHLPKTAFKKGNKPYVRTEKHKEIMRGEKNPRWKGGKRTMEGYVYLLRPNHPFARKGYIAEHRLVMEKQIRRYLKPEEIIHHINGNKTDNRLENLQLFKNTSEHHKYTHYCNPVICPHCHKTFKL